jgi:hypothetical protein
MTTFHIEKINDIFKLPISYNKDKMVLNSNIITDLELTETIDPSGTSIYHYTFQPTSKFGNEVIKQLPKAYTTDVSYLKDSQKLLKNYKSLNCSDDDDINHNENNDEILEIWDDIKNDTGFKDRYQYIDWPQWEFLNNNEFFLQILSIYSMASPVLSLLVPFIILIIPFFVIQMKGISISITEYINILKVVAANHAIGKLFTQFNSVKMNEKLYLLVSAAFYIFSIYQNILTCIRFNDNMKEIHDYLNKIKNYISYTERNTTNFLNYSSELSTYSEFNQTLIENTIILKQYRQKLESIQPYKLSIQKVTQLGHILKCFYELHDNKEYNDAFLYSFGFNGYIDNLDGLSENISKSHIHFCKLKKSKKDKKHTTTFSNSYYPAHINNNSVKNTIKIDKNIIVTGPNASGKTTILKSSLINVILTQQFGCGFFSSAIVSPYKYIHCYLNIPDTSGRDSLFQAEARRCKEIIDIVHENPKSDHFCVFDELYSGTNPDEAVSSASAFMLYLAKYKNVNCILTTHFFKLCKHLDNNDKFKNQHMETLRMDDNSKNFSYTYLLKNGISNVRGGIKVLKDMNYPQEIIDNSDL